MGCSRLAVTLILGSAVGGCGWFGSREPRSTIAADAFYRASPGEVDRQRAGEVSGAIPMARVEPETAPRVPTAAQRTDQQPRVTSIAPAVREVVQAPATRPINSDAPTSIPASQNPPPIANGAQYQTVGGVVTEVSGTPIYADRVVQQLAKMLSAEAKQKDIDAYRTLVRREVEKQVTVMIRSELEFAAANQAMGNEERTFAENLTTAWRQRQITEAGGSVEMARRRAAADGQDFDEKVREQYRFYLVQIFYQKKVFPKVQITAEDMRRYYEQHLKNEFTESDQAQFRVIRISTKNMGSREAAIEKAKTLREQATGMNDEEFAKLAGSINHDPALMKSAGRVGGGDGWVQRGAYAVTKVEDALWTLEPGSVTPVIESGDSFYFARLENKRNGRVRKFEDQDVQNSITDTLRKAQVASRREAYQQRLMKDAVIFPYPPQFDSAVEIAMQRYPQWAKAQ